MRDETVDEKVIQETKHVTYKYEQPLIFVDNCEIKFSTFENFEHFYFDTDKTSMNFLAQKFGIKIKQLTIHNDDYYFATPIYFNRYIIPYAVFKDMFLNEKLHIKKIDTKIRISKYKEHDSLSNIVVGIWCE